MRCKVVRKEHVGAIHLHCRWWHPNRVAQMWFQPVDRSVMYPVPEAVWDDLWAVSSYEQAMALLRGAEDPVAAD